MTIFDAEVHLGGGHANAVAERCDNVRSLMVWRNLFAPDVNDPGAYCSYCCAASRASTRLAALLCLPGRGDVSSFTCVYAVGEIFLRIGKCWRAYDHHVLICRVPGPVIQDT